MIGTESECIALDVKRVSCSATGVHHGAYAEDKLLYVWDVPTTPEDEHRCQPWPPLELPSTVLGLSLFGDGRMLAVTSCSLLSLRITDGSTRTDCIALTSSISSTMAVGNTTTTKAPISTDPDIAVSLENDIASVVTSSGSAIILVGLSDPFLTTANEMKVAVVDLRSFLTTPATTTNTVSSSSPASSNLNTSLSVGSASSSMPATPSLQSVAFSSTHVFAVARSGDVVILPLAWVREVLQRAPQSMTLPSSQQQTETATLGLSTNQAVTAAMYDDITEHLIVGLNDGSVVCMNTGGGSYRVVARVDLLTGLQNSIDEDEALNAPGLRVDLNHIHAHPSAIVPFGRSILVATQVALVCLNRTDLMPTQHFLFTSGFSPSVALSSSGVALIEFPVESKLVLQRYGRNVYPHREDQYYNNEDDCEGGVVKGSSLSSCHPNDASSTPFSLPSRVSTMTPAEQTPNRQASPSGDTNNTIISSYTPRPVSVGHIPRPSFFLPAHSDVSEYGDDDSVVINAAYKLDPHGSDEGHSEGDDVQPDDEELPNVITATVPLPPKYLEPLKLLDPSTMMAPKSSAPSAFGGGKKPPLATPPSKTTSAAPPPMFSKGAKNPNLNAGAKKPVTFRKTVASSGYSANLPWSEQQRLKERAKRQAVAAKKNPPSAAFSKMYPADAGYPETPKEKANALLADSKVHQGAVNSMCYDAEGKYLVTGSTDSTISMLKCPVVANNGATIVARGHKGLVVGVDVSLDTNAHPMILSAGSDGHIGMWHPTRREHPFVMDHVTAKKPSASVCAAKYFYMDKLVVAGVGSSLQFYKYVLDSGGGDLDRFRNWSRLENVGTYRTDAQSVTALDCINSSLSTVVVWAGSNKEVGVVDVATERTIRRIDNAHDRPIHSLEMMSGSRYASVSEDALHRFATSGFDSLTKIWDMRAVGSPSMVLSRHENWGIKVGMCFSPCGNFFVMGSQDCAAYVYDLRMVGDDSGGQPILSRLKTSDAVTACRFHPLNPTVALGTSGGDVRFFGTAI